MNGLSRIFFPIIGLFLIVISLMTFADGQMRGLIVDDSRPTPASTPDEVQIPITESAQQGSVPTPVKSATFTATPSLPTVTPFVVIPPTTVPSSGGGGNGYVVNHYADAEILFEHIVKSGEDIKCIARAYAVYPYALAEVNNHTITDKLSNGEELGIPAVQWEQMQPGYACMPQFQSDFPGAAIFLTPSPSGGMLPGEFSNNEVGYQLSGLYLMNFSISEYEPKKSNISSEFLDNVATPEPVAETRTVKVILPQKMHLGESSQVVLFFNPITNQAETTIINPDDGNVTAVTTVEETGQNSSVSNPLIIPAVFDGYWIYAIADMNTLGFEYTPDGDVMQVVKLDKGLTWRWSIKPLEMEHQELNIHLRLHFEPKAKQPSRPDEEIWSNSYDVSVTRNLFASLFGAQANIFAIFSLITGSIVSVFPILDKIKPLFTKS